MSFALGIVDLPLLRERLVVGVKLELVGFEANLVEKGIETLEIHLVHILLVYAFS